MSGKSHTKSDINVTPLIDIVLVLLIVFIVMVPGMSKALPVVVPQVVQTTTPPKPDPRNPPVVLEIEPKADQASYKISLQGEELQIDQIVDKLSPVVQLQPAGMRKIFLKVDEDVVYQVAVNVLDQVRRASDRAKRETQAKPEFGGMDGGDIKVTVSLKKRPAAAA